MFKTRLFYRVIRFSFFIIFGFLTFAIKAQQINPQSKNKIAEQIENAKNARTEFLASDLFIPQIKQLSIRVDEILKQSTIAQLDNSSLKSILDNKPKGVSFSLPFLNATLQIELVQQTIFTDDCEVYTSESPNTPIKVNSGLYYRGIINGDENSVVGISFFENEVYGMISSAEYGNITINKMEDENTYLIYSDRDLDAHYGGTCETQEPEGYANVIEKSLDDKLEIRAGKCVKVYLETDYALYQNKGYNTNNVINYITAVFNNLAVLYSNESITTEISQIFVWTTQDSYSKTNSSTALNQFRNNRQNFNGDIAHLAALGGNNLGGVAWVNVLCNKSYSFAYSNISATYQNVPTYSWTVEVMTHEMGHNLGSPHTHSCSWPGGAIDNCYTPEGNCSSGPPPSNGGTIMSYCHLTNYGINFNNGFGPQPGDLIRSKVNAASCLGTCDNGGCSAPSGLAITNIQNTSATATWNSVSGASAYQVQYRAVGGSWNILAQTSSTSQNITGLTAGTTYEVQVRSICSGVNSSWSSSVTFTTSGGSSCGTVTGLNASNITSTSATVSWSAVSGAINYDLDYKLNSSSSWTTYNTTSTVVNFTSLTPGTSYNVRVRANCSGGSGAYSTILTFTTLNGSSYCTSKGSNAAYEWIDLVRLNTINNPTGSNGGYADFTNISTSLTKGTAYTATLSAGQSGGNYREYWNVWIDFNNDGDFADAGENVIHKSATGSGNVTGTFTIPTNAVTGTTRMRVSMKYGSYAGYCETFTYGEVEDYSVNLTGNGGLPAGISGVIAHLNVYPNPVNDLLYVQFSSVISGQVNIAVLDITGKQVQLNTYEMVVGENYIPVEVQNFQPGIYIIECKNDQTRKYTKVVKE